MSSAEDTTPLTASPSVGSTESSAAGPAAGTPGVPAATEEFPVESREETSTEVDAAQADASSSSEEPRNELIDESVVEVKTAPLPKVNAVAHEARVKITGARPANAGGERELFTESTTTVLVFEKGGVIVLTAAVAPGQLLFLTNEETKREVVAQVTRKRAHRPTDCYVELEFTEPAPKFWGMEFSAATALLPKDKKQEEAAALVASAETTADELGQPPSATSEEVLALKKEVEALRKQLNLLQTPAPAPSVETESQAPTPATESAPPPAPIEVVSFPAVPAAPADDASLLVLNHESIGAPIQAPEDEPIAYAAKSLPLDDEQAPPATPVMTPAEQESLPKPALDFSMSLPKRKKRSFRARGNFTPGFRTGMLRVSVLAMALVVTIIGAAWYKDWLPWKHTAKKIAVASWTAPVNTTPAAGSVGKGAAETGTASAQPTTGKKGTGAAPSENRASVSADPGNSTKPPVTAETPVDPSVPEVVATQPSGRGTATTLTPAVKRTPVRPVPPSGGDPAASSPEDAAIVPPKLLRSAQAVASLDDLRDFETGSVVIDALVDTSGMVSSMNVLSGPPSLRGPAMEALKDYRYVPATRNGKPIPAHVKVKIQFHFE